MSAWAMRPAGQTATRGDKLIYHVVEGVTLSV